MGSGSGGGSGGGSGSGGGDRCGMCLEARVRAEAKFLRVYLEVRGVTNK